MYKRKLLGLMLAFIVINTSACSNIISNQENTIDTAIPVDLQVVLDNTVQSEAAKKSHLTGISLTFQCLGINSNLPATYTSGAMSNKPDAEALPKNAIFQVGSMTKSAVAVVALQLANEGAFGNRGLDSTVGDLLKHSTSSSGWNIRWNQISLRQLLNMTSGIPEYSDDDGYMMAKFSKDPYYQFTTDELLASVASKALLFKPGYGWYYSNTNYALINKVIFSVTGISIKEQIIARVIKPLKLSHTYYVDNISEDAIFDQKQKVLLMSGYDYQELPIKLQTQYLYPGVDIKSYSLSWTNAAGSIISDTTDFNNYVRALFNGNLLNSNQLQQFTSIVAMNDNSKYKAGQAIETLDNETQAGYGLGVQEFILNTPDNKKAIFYGHMGGTMGFSSQWLYQKDRQASTVFETNTTSNLANDIFNSKVIPQILDKVIDECGLDHVGS